MKLERDITEMGKADFKTPYFVIHKNQLEDGLNHLKKALSDSWGNYIIGYSYKTNSLPWIISYFHNMGCYAEVVSDDEYQLAKYIGVKDGNILYNGIAKKKESFLNVIRNQGVVNIDSEYEIDWLDELAYEGYGVGVRVNFDLEKMCPGQTQCGNEGERFGFCYENGELKRAIDKIKGKGIQIRGLHLHKSSMTRNPDIYKAISEAAVEIGEKYQLQLDYVDIGGGFFGEMEGKPGFEDYFSLVSGVLRKFYTPEKTTLIVEPGMALIGAPVSYVTSVVDVKSIPSSLFVITDGSRTQIDPLMRKNSYFYSVCRENEMAGDIAEKQVICGYTCMEHDRIFSIENEGKILPGDKICFERVGAYTMCLTPLFTKYFTDVYLENDGEYHKIRNKWDAGAYSANSKIDTSDENNILILSSGTRNKVIEYFKRNLRGNGRVIATDVSKLAPALYDADAGYVVKHKVTEEGYIDEILDICRKEKIRAALSLIDTELGILAKNELRFHEIGTMIIGSGHALCEMSLDKYAMYQWLTDHGYHCAKTWVDKNKFFEAAANKEVFYPVFVKPIKGSASIEISLAYDKETVELLFEHQSGLMVQEFLKGQEIGADVYIDMISGEVVSIFTKRKIKMRAGETDKAVSFKDENLFELIEKFVIEAGYRGQIDIDIFDMDGQYYISEVNPRFGGGYPHAYECGANHMKLVLENMKGNVNAREIGNYKEGVYMMKYNEVCIC